MANLSFVGVWQAALHTLPRIVPAVFFEWFIAGWTALAGMAALVVMLLTVATWSVRQFVMSPSRSGYDPVKGDVLGLS